MLPCNSHILPSVAGPVRRVCEALSFVSSTDCTLDHLDRDNSMVTQSPQQAMMELTYPLASCIS